MRTIERMSFSAFIGKFKECKDKGYPISYNRNECFIKLYHENEVPIMELIYRDNLDKVYQLVDGEV